VDSIKVLAGNTGQAAFIAGALFGATVILGSPRAQLLAKITGIGAVQDYIEELLHEVDVDVDWAL
jgi:hypothetical protein